MVLKSRTSVWLPNALLDAVEVQHRAPQPRRVRHRDLDRGARGEALVAVLALQVVQAVDARLLLPRAGAGGAAHPGQLLLQQAAALVGLDGEARGALGLGFQVLV
jgi:hypothetical protein